MGNIAMVDEPRKNHEKRVDRYSRWKRRSVEVADYIGKTGDPGTAGKAERLRTCHDWLLFRHYYHIDKIRLAHTSSCHMHLLCPMCAIRRAASAVQRYHGRYEIITNEQPLRLYYAVLTAPNGDSLTERFTHVETAVRGLLSRRRDAMKAKNGSKRNAYALDSQYADIDGGAYSFEIQRGKRSGLWHPHINLLMVSRDGIDPSAFVDEWIETTGDAREGGQYCVEIDPDESKGAFVEVMKYALKHSAMPVADTYHAYQSLTGRHLLGSFGAFRGVKVPDVPDNELLTSPYVEMLYRYAQGGYRRIADDGSIHTMPLLQGRVSTEMQ